MTGETFSENQILRGKVKCPECGAIMASGGMTRYTLKDGETGTLYCQCGHVETRPIKREIRRK
jgi:RNase P subunit RPR2